MIQENCIYSFLNQQKEKLEHLEVLTQTFDGLEKYPLGLSQCLYVYNYQLSSVIFQKGVFEFLGYTTEEFNSELIHSYFHPDDEGMVIRIIQAAVAYAIDNNLYQDGHLYLTFRLRKKNGEYIKVLRQSNVFEVDKNGRFISNLSLLTDISYMNTANCVEWKFDASGLNQDAFKKYIGHQYENFFSARELEIVNRIYKGLNSEAIGKELFISKHTVDTHRRNILKKVGCKNTPELLNFCNKIGLLRL